MDDGRNGTENFGGNRNIRAIAGAHLLWVLQLRPILVQDEDIKSNASNVILQEGIFGVHGKNIGEELQAIILPPHTIKLHPTMATDQR